MVKVFIDPGHGGKDSGAVGNGLKEKDLTLSIAKGIEKGLKKYNNVSVKMSRSTDVYPSLEERVKMANQWYADLYVSPHINAGGGTGFESFIHSDLSNSSKTNKIRNTIHDEIMLSVHDIKDRGKKKANYYVLGNSKMDAVLTECLFIDTVADANKLKDNKVIQNFIQGHIKGIVKYYGLKLKNEENEPSPTSKTYRVVCGSFKEKKNATKRMNELKALKFDTFLLRNNSLYQVIVGSYSVKNNAEKRVKELDNLNYESFIDVVK